MKILELGEAKSTFYSSLNSHLGKSIDCEELFFGIENESLAYSVYDLVNGNIKDYDFTMNELEFWEVYQLLAYKKIKNEIQNMASKES